MRGFTSIGPSKDCSFCSFGCAFGVALSQLHTHKTPHRIVINLSCRGPSSYNCCAKLPVGMEERKKTFGVGEASLLVKELRNNFKSGKTKSYEWRVAQLGNLARMLQEKEKLILEALNQDLGKHPVEAFVSEIAMIGSSCKKALEDLKQWMTPEEVKTTMSTYPSSAEIIPEPLGVVLVISTWNFPFMLSIDPLVGAISAGNAVVLKPSEIAPATSKIMAELLEEYLDNSYVRVVEGAVPEATALLEQKWDKIFFTGGTTVGRIVMAAAAKNLTPVVLELGGKCPAVIDSTLNLEVATRRIIAGKWACNSGQACIGIDYIITTKDFAPKLIESLRNGLKECFGEYPMQSKDLSRIVNSFHFRRLVNLMDEDKVSDRVVIGGQRNESQLRIAPTVLLDVPTDSMIMQEEIFGPLLPIVTVESLEDGIELIKERPKPLAAYLFSNDENLKKSFVQNVQSGGMSINDAILQVTISGLPFGGVGESGFGSYHGKFSFDAFSHKKAVLYRSFDGDSTVRYPPYTAEKEKVLKALFNGGVFNIIRALLGW